MKTLTPWITLHTWILLPKALQVWNGFILLVSTHLEAPSHIYRGVTPATPWLKPWHVAPGTDLGKVTRKLHLKGESRWPHPLVGRPVGPATSHRLCPGSFQEDPCYIATCQSHCYINLLHWWALQSMWWLQGDAWLNDAFAPWIKGCDCPSFFNKNLHS